MKNNTKLAIGQNGLNKSYYNMKVVFDNIQKVMSIQVGLKAETNVFKRLVTCIKYLFGSDEDLGFESFILREEKILDLHESITKFSNNHGFKIKGAKKIKKALKDIQSGYKNPVLTRGTHKLGDITNSYKVRK